MHLPPTKTSLLAAAVALTALGACPPAPGRAAHTPAAAPQAQAPTRPDGSGRCTFPSEQHVKARPWSLQRVLLDELWQGTRKGKGVRVAVIDTGVDDKNPQLSDAVDRAAGRDLLSGGKSGDPTDDEVGHGTKVAGIIAARPAEETGFVGLAPNSVIIPVRQNDADSSGDSDSMAVAIEHAVARRADVINISQDTTKPLSPTSALAGAVREAVARGVVVVASAGNDGLDGRNKKTYPAAFDGVLAVASSDRNNERAPFSQAGPHVGVAAPGVDIVSTVPGGGQCTDSGTSFSAPFVAGVAALLKEKHPDWTSAQIVTQIQRTAERSVNGRDDYVGWGVVDPVRAVQDSDVADPPSSPTPDPGPRRAQAPDVPPFSLAETAAERDRRYATYALGVVTVLLTVTAGTAVVVRDLRRRRGRGLS